MKILRENLALWILVVLSLSCFASFAFLSSNLTEDIKELRSDIRGEQNKRSSIEEDISAFVNLESDFLIVRRELMQLAELDKKQRIFWKTILNSRENHMEKWIEKSPESVNADITRLFTSLRSRCASAEVGLPAGTSKSPTIGFGENKPKPRNSYGFGFSSYDGFWPSFKSEEAKMLGIQAKIVKELVEFITQSSTESQPLSIVEILREPAGTEDLNHIEGDRLQLASDKNLLVRQEGIIKTFAFRVSLRGQTKHARNFINKLRPPFLLRNFSVERDLLPETLEKEPEDFAPNPFGQNDDLPPVKSPPLPIVKDVNSEFVFLIEYVVSISNELDVLVEAIKNWEKFDEEIISEFLTESGNSEKIEAVISAIKNDQ